MKIAIVLYTILIFCVMCFGGNNRFDSYVYVDVIEYNKSGGTVEQFILWAWSPDQKRYNCNGWILDAHCSITKTDDIYTLRTFRNGKIITIKSKIYIKTITKEDPERANSKIFPSKYRRLLR